MESEMPGSGEFGFGQRVQRVADLVDGGRMGVDALIPGLSRKAPEWPLANAEAWKYPP